MEKIRQVLSTIVNICVAYLGSPWGVIVTFAICLVAHIGFTLHGDITTVSAHYLDALSEFAIVAASMILHSGIVSDKATHVKLDALAKAAPDVDNRLMGLETKKETEIEELRSEVLEIQSEQPPRV